MLGSGSRGSARIFRSEERPVSQTSPQQKNVYGQLANGGNVILQSNQMDDWGLEVGDLLPEPDVQMILYGGAKAW